MPETDLVGVLLLDKTAGMTSHDVIDHLRRALHMQRISHAGTLDPDATGLLIVCLGKATKVSALLCQSDKTYRVGFLLGRETTTYDATGAVTAERPVHVEEATLLGTLKTFLGEQEQKPPVYSAIKVQGRRLYEYARKGEAVEVPIRHVTVFSLRLLEYRTPVGELEVVCSKGTYVRSLVHDLGQRLGCGAIATAIRRVSAGCLRVEDALSLQRILEQSKPREFVSRSLLAISHVLGGLPRLRVTDGVLRRVMQGAGLRPPEMRVCRWDVPAVGAMEDVLVVGSDGQAVALGSFDGDATLRVRRVL